MAPDFHKLSSTTFGKLWPKSQRPPPPLLKACGHQLLNLGVHTGEDVLDDFPDIVLKTLTKHADGHHDNCDDKQILNRGLSFFFF
jgi:hypothetical protein